MKSKEELEQRAQREFLNDVKYVVLNSLWDSDVIKGSDVEGRIYRMTKAKEILDAGFSSYITNP